MQMATAVANQRVPVLLVLTEQSRSDVTRIFERINPDADHELLQRIEEYVAVETMDDVTALPALIRRRVPEYYEHTQVIIVDSIQGSGLAATATRSYQQLFNFVDEARARGIATCLISHVTKRGAVAGPRSLQHKVDVAVVLRKALGVRQMFIAKNRFGPEIVDPILLDVTAAGLAPSRHATESISAAYGYAGVGDELLEIQAAVTLPKLNGRAELACPFLPNKRVKQILATLSGLPGIDVSDLSYSINAYLPDARGYLPPIDLPLALAILAAYLHRPLPAQTVFAGALDLRRTVRSPDGAYLYALGQLLGDSLAPAVRRVVLPRPAIRLLHESFPTDRPRPDVEIVGIQTLDELLVLLWPDAFASCSE